MSQHTPDTVPHPGLELQEWLDERSMTRKDGARLSGISLPNLTKICEGRKNIGYWHSCALSVLTGVPSQYWRDRQKQYDLANFR